MNDKMSPSAQSQSLSRSKTVSCMQFYLQDTSTLELCTKTG